MTLTIAQVEHIAKLARLELSEEEKAVFARQLSDILGYVDKLTKANTEGVEPMAHSIPIRNVFGDDVPAPASAEERNGVLANFPERQGDLLKVKAVFGK